MARTPMKIGILGCGVISGIYIENSKKLDAIELAAVADVNPTAARYRADQYGIERAITPEELLADPEIELIISLTPNRLHGEIGKQILNAGKHLYSEKPLSVYREEALCLLKTASEKGLRVGGAPDTFFGGAWQTARKAIDDGLIGRPIGAFAYLQNRRSQPGPAAGGKPPTPQSATRTPAPGHVSFFMRDAFKFGVSSIFDMGGYYLANLVNLLGPAKSVMGATMKVSDEITRGDQTVQVTSPTTVTGLLEFQNGAFGQVVVSSDIYGTGLPHIEIYGTEGTLRLPDPNHFLGPVYLRKPESQELIPLECKHQYNQDSRGVGVADMAVAIKNGRPHRASGEFEAHIVDIMNALHESWDQGKRIDLTTAGVQPKALPVGLPNWEIDD